ncbi:MAG: periplasmic binding protein [Fibrobacteres bacterium]|nr:periplasmic binding protein [Fibrobacterota bacterium]
MAHGELYLQPFAGRMMEKFTLPWTLLFAAICLGCREDQGRSAERRAVAPSDPSVSAAASPGATGGLRYARVFTLGRRGDTTVIEVRKPWQGATVDFTYLLVPAGLAPAMASAPNTLAVPVPVRRAVTLTTTNLYHLQTLGVLDALVGLGGGRYVCSPEVRSRLRSGRIRDVGEDIRMDAEAVVALKPDLVFTYVVGRSSDGAVAKLAETGVPVAIEGSYMEESPLGRAEWIKFTGAFFGRGAAADSAFDSIDSSYRALAALARTATHRPKVFVGAPFGGVWWVPSGRTYVGRLLADAGADYLWADDTTRGSLNLDMEAVLGRAADADFWMNAGEWKDLADARRQDPRNALYKAWKEGRVYVNDAIRCEEGGRDFYETGASRPDLILADLISVFHPELLPGHSLRWYRRLPEGK